MTRLAQVKAERDAALQRVSTLEILATLILLNPPDHVETVKDPYSGFYKIEAYGLTRMNGGYVVVRFVQRGQRDHVSFDEFDKWRAAQRERGHTIFAVAADKIAHKRWELLDRKPGVMP